MNRVINLLKRDFSPLADPLSLGLIVVCSAWSFTIVQTELYKQDIPDMSVPFGIITATLGFILPLQMSASISKNKECMDNYNAFCGDVMALAWETITVARKPENDSRIQKLFDIYFIFPTAVKWKFRGGLDMKKIYLLKNGDKDQVDKKKDVIVPSRQKFIDTSIGQEHSENMAMMTMDETDLLFLHVFDLINELVISDTKKNMLIRTAERVYGAYGNMGNLSGYEPPRLFTSFLNSALVLYVLLIPFSFDIDVLKMNIIWQSCLVIYFFLGINIVGKKVANAYVSSTVSGGAFQTVGASETDTNLAIHSIYSRRKDIAATKLLSNQFHISFR